MTGDPAAEGAGSGTPPGAEPAPDTAPAAADEGAPAPDAAPAAAATAAPALDERTRLLVERFLARLAATPTHDEAFGRLAAELGAIGEREVVATSQMSVWAAEGQLREGGGRAGPDEVARSLADLRRIAEELDERAREGALDASTAAQTRARSVVGRLHAQRAGLVRDLAAVEQERRALRRALGSLRRYAALAGRLDEALERHAAEIDRVDPERAALVRAELLFTVRQRQRDLLVQLAVATQGDAGLAIVERNARELIRAIEVATTTTLAALQAALAVARATAARRILEERMAARRRAPGGARRSEQPPTGTQPGAFAEIVDPATLRRAWAQVVATLDDVDRAVLEAAAEARLASGTLRTAVDRATAAADAAGAPAEEQAGSARTVDAPATGSTAEDWPASPSRRTQPRR